MQSFLTKSRRKSRIDYHRESLKSKNILAQIPGVTLKEGQAYLKGEIPGRGWLPYKKAKATASSPQSATLAAVAGDDQR